MHDPNLTPYDDDRIRRGIDIGADKTPEEDASAAAHCLGLVLLALIAAAPIVMTVLVFAL